MPGRQLCRVENTGPHYHLQDHSILDKLIKMSTRGCGLYGRWSDDEDEWRQDRGVEELVQPWWRAGSPHVGPPCRAAGSCSCRAGQATGPLNFLQTPSHPARRQGLLCWQKMWGAHVWAPAGPWPLTTRLVQPQWGPPSLRPWASWGSPFLYFNYITNIVFLCFSSGAMRQYWPAVGRITASTAACSSHRV